MAGSYWLKQGLVRWGFSGVTMGMVYEGGMVFQGFRHLPDMF